MMDGEGKYEWPAHKVKYEGQFALNTLSGSGRYYWPDGSSYEGQVKNSLRHGHGTFTAAAGVPKVCATIYPLIYYAADHICRVNAH